MNFGHHRAALARLDPSLPPANQLLYSSVFGGTSGTTTAVGVYPDGHGGAYLGDCQLGVPGGDPGERGFEAHAADPAIAKRLWAESEKWVGQTFDL